MNEQLTQFLVDFELLDDNGEAVASITHNPNVSWAKVVFTDDVPNYNKQRVPKDEFPNVLQTGALMPIKMATGRINDGHERAIPLGVISHLKDEGNKILGLAALWRDEREEDIELLKAMMDTETKPQLSWELHYDNFTEDENGIKDLHGVVVKALTIVGNPAYKGRTPIIAMASQQNTESSSTEVTIVNEDEYKAKIKELEDRVTQLLGEIKSKDEAITAQTAELTPLKEFKASVEKEKADTQKFVEIKNKFKEAGIEKDEAYFETNKDSLMAMAEAKTLDFVLQELVAFSSANKTNEADASVSVPRFTAKKQNESKDIKSIVDALRKSNLTKK